MAKVSLTKGIYWVGAIDWNLRDFHGYHTSRGTTYNSYLIVDEKVALVDTVKASFFPEMLGNIKEIIDPEKIDYIIANHVEIDHSGSLPLMVKEAGRAKVVSTQKGKEGLKKYYAADWPSLVVKTGDKIELGKRSLEFIEAPMLHWPDSMFTYIRQEELLLPNDGFGQHLATTGRFDDETEAAMEEAAKYYANILMPFSSLITRMLNKIKDMDLKIKMIAPSHGVIWRSEPGRIIEAYAKWAAGETEKKILIIYDTMWESTDIMARAILKGVMDEGGKAKVFHLRRTEWSDILKEVLDAEAILVGSPTLHNGLFPPVAGFLTYLKSLKPKGKIGAAFGSYGWSGGAVKKISEELKAAGMEVIEPNLSFQYRPDKEELNRCYEFGKEMAGKVKTR
jgi:flavorubredoxin